MRKHSIALALINAIVSTGAIVNSVQAQSAFYSNATDTTLLFEGTALAPFEANIWLGGSATKVANPCGLTIFSTLDNPGQSVSVAGSNIGYSNLPVQTIPVCSGGVLSEPRTANFRTAEGRTVLVGQTGSVTAQYLVRRKRSGSFNACGFRTVNIKNAATLGADSIVVDFGGQSNGMGDLEQVASLPVCKKVGNDFIKYIKAP